MDTIWNELDDAIDKEIDKQNKEVGNNVEIENQDKKNELEKQNGNKGKEIEHTIEKKEMGVEQVENKDVKEESSLNKFETIGDIMKSAMEESGNDNKDATEIIDSILKNNIDVPKGNILKMGKAGGYQFKKAEQSTEKAADEFKDKKSSIDGMTDEEIFYGVDYEDIPFYNEENQKDMEDSTVVKERKKKKQNKKGNLKKDKTLDTNKTKDLGEFEHEDTKSKYERDESSLDGSYFYRSEYNENRYEVNTDDAEEGCICRCRYAAQNDLDMISQYADMIDRYNTLLDNYSMMIVQYGKLMEKIIS